MGFGCWQVTCSSDGGGVMNCFTISQNGLTGREMLCPCVKSKAPGPSLLISRYYKVEMVQLEAR